MTITTVHLKPSEKLFESPRRVYAPRRLLTAFEIRETIQNVCSRLVLDNSQLKQMMSTMEKSINEGLAKETASTAAVRMLPSFVRSVPNGSELGDFLALDLGGTNFRVLLVRLTPQGAQMMSKIFRVPDNLMKGTGEALFDHIAHCMAIFMEENGIDKSKKLPLGFTFSFPCKQEGLTRGTLINWTKGFKASGVEGMDVVELLRDACHRRKDIDIDVVALLNDTVGTLMACAYKENACEIGIIVGTGTNAAYMEKLDRCPKLEGVVNKHDGPDQMIINTEWGAFGDDGALAFLRTEFDDVVDKSSINPGKQLFEKMISGMYLGELTRVILERLARDKLLFGGHYSAIAEPHSFPTKYVSEIEAELKDDEEQTFAKTYSILEDIGVEGLSTADCANVAYVCSVVSSRAAFLTAAGIAMLIRRMGKKNIVIGVDGSVYRFHPTFPTLLNEKIGELLDNNGQEYRLMLSEDGSGRGAALVAAVATRLKQEKAGK